MTRKTPSLRSFLIGLIVALCLSTPVVAVAAPFPALPEVAPAPTDNPTTPAKVELGRMLYMDPRFSASGTVSCNSCHNVMLGGDDNRPVSVGVHGQTGGRSAPTVWNAAFSSAQFWDGRAATLEEQALGPIVNPVEMGMSDIEQAMQRVRGVPGYAAYFEKAFGDDSMTAEHAAKAIAAYERTLITPNSPYDRYARGDTSALSAQQVQGLKTFTEVGCNACHSGAAFNGPALPVGTPFLNTFPVYKDNAYVAKYALDADTGREEVTNKEADRNRFKVPTLRNIALTAPYFHNGAVATLEEAVQVMAKVQLNRELTPQQVADIVAFLHALTGEFPAQTMPRLPATTGWTFEFSSAK